MQSHTVVNLNYFLGHDELGREAKVSIDEVIGVMNNDKANKHFET